MFGKEFLFIIKSTKKTIFYTLMIYKNRECLGKKSFNHIRYKKNKILNLIIYKNWECLGKNFY
jgi:hypothetical protein